MICINKTSQEFKYLAKKYGLSTDTLETIVYKYYIQKNSEDTFPSGTYIKAQIGELPYRESSRQTIEFWNKLYKGPKVFDTSKQMLAAKKEAERYFIPGRVFIYTNNEGKYVLKVQEPVEKLDVTRESFNEEQDWLDYNLAKGTPVQTSEDNKKLQTALSTIDKAINVNNWTKEALDTLKDLNTEDYGKILKQFSQEELRSSNGVLAQAETILARGGNQADRGNSQTYNAERAGEQEQQVESWAKANNLWYNNYQESKDGSLESVIETEGGLLSNNSGSEAMMFYTKNPFEEGIIKAISTDHYNNLQGLLDKIILHNSIFPETAYTVLGFGKDKGGVFRIIVRQKFVRGTEPSVKEINKFVEKLGLEKKGGWYYTKDGKKLTDLNPKNIIKAPDGTMLVINCDIEFTAEHLQKSLNNTIQASISPVQSEEFYSKDNADDYVQTLITDGTPRENIQVTYTPETDTEDEYWTVTIRQPQTNKEITSQLVDYLGENIKHLGLSVKNRADMEMFFKEHPNTLIQMAIGKISINNTLSEAEKENIRTLLKTINKTGTTLLDDGEGTMYLIDHADREDIENRNPKTQDGFNCRLKFSTDGYTSEDINNIKEEIENGNIRNQKDFNRWASNHSKRQGSNNSDSIDVEDRRTNANNAGLDSEAQQGESRRRQNNPNSQENFGTGFIRVYGNDGINGPRYTQINDRVNQFFVAPQGEIYGFVDKEGNIYLDETVISPEHPIHEYTHLWDRIVAKKNPKLWQRGVELMKQTSLWNKIANDDNYGKLWQSKGITGDKLTNLIASEVHAKFVGEGGADLLDRLAKERGQKDIIAKLKDWILEVWKDLKATFSNWSDEEVAKLTLKDFNHMVVRDLADGSLWTKQANNVSEVPIEASLPNYRNFYSISEPITVDAEWKVPILENLDSQLSAENTETENRGIVDQIEWVIEATSEEEYSKADTREKRQLQERIKDYRKKNAQLNNLLDNNLDLTGTEIREVAGQIVDYISDLITEVQQTPEVTKKYWPDLNTSLDLSKESREEIIKVVGINRLLKSAKDYLGNLMNSDDAELEELYDSTKLIEQVHLILKNWDAMLLFAGDFFAVNEKIGLRRNSLTHSYEAIKKKYESFRSEYDDTDDEDDVEKEEERDTQQSWQIESMTISAINSMSDLVKNTLHECYILDKNGKKVLSKFGIPLRVQKSKAVKNILYWTSGADTLDKMIKAIEKKQDTETWTQSLLDKLKDKSGKYADFQSQFFTVMRRHKQLFGVGRKIKNKGTKGRYVSQVVNRNEVRLSLFKAIVANYNANNVPLVNNGRINTRSLEMLRGWHEELRNIIKQSDAEARKNKYYDYAVYIGLYSS